ncbi:MAG: hypothetical protein M1812_002163 [Candelaria pacifica]|nr:MAG: hypothetical protein M1812_002163 [Candelaria pacifica]
MIFLPRIAFIALLFLSKLSLSWNQYCGESEADGYGRPEPTSCLEIINTHFPHPYDIQQGWVAGLAIPVSSRGSLLRQIDYPIIFTPQIFESTIANTPMGCVVAVYNKAWVANSLGYSDIETWGGVQRAATRLVQGCAPYGGAEYVGYEANLVVYVYEPGSDIGVQLEQGKRYDSDTPSNKHFLRLPPGKFHHGPIGYSGPSEEQSEPGEASQAGATSEQQQIAPAATYCKASIGPVTEIQCVKHTLKSSILFGQTISLLSEVSTYV